MDEVEDLFFENLSLSDCSEYDELLQNIQYENITDDILEKTTRRYKRYLENVEYWIIEDPVEENTFHDKSHIKLYIEQYLDLTKIFSHESKHMQILYMKLIDNEMMKSITKK